MRTSSSPPRATGSSSMTNVVGVTRHGEEDQTPAAVSFVDNSIATVNDNNSHDSHNHTTIKANTRDQRFVCAICLETVGDEPVVTQCGHLYCWPCLYQWLQPGITSDEYYSVFGASSTQQFQQRPQSIGDNYYAGTGARVGLNFMHHNHLFPSQQNQRRCCPVCKSDCTVDSVIPIYIHAHELGTSPSASTAEKMILSAPTKVAHAADEEAVRLNSSSSYSSLEEADEEKADEATNDDTSLTNDSNTLLGIRQRRRHQKRRRPQSDNDGTNSVDNLSRSPTRSVDNTPVHRNTSCSSSSNTAPSRPSPNSPWRIPTVTSERGTSAAWDTETAVSASRRGSSSELNEEALSLSLPPSFSSSPFRLALRPRHPSSLLSNGMDRPLSQPQPPLPPPPARQRLQHAQQQNNQRALNLNNPQTFTTIHNHHRHQYGRLTSALLLIVDAIENNIGAAVSTTGTSRSENGGGVSTPTDPSMPVVPPLHQSDGGMGGFRHRHNSENIGSSDNVGLSQRISTIEGTYDFHGISDSMNGYESSLVAAREFLSRLLLMLASFVVLCLLLF